MLRSLVLRCPLCSRRTCLAHCLTDVIEEKTENEDHIQKPLQCLHIVLAALAAYYLSGAVCSVGAVGDRKQKKLNRYILIYIPGVVDVL